MSRENASVQLITSSGRVINSIDPVRIEDYLRSKRLPCSFRGKANSYLAKRDAPGQGWLLIKRSDLLLIDQTATTHKIRFTAGSTSVTVEKLHVYSAKGVTTSQAQQDDDIFLVEFRDMRQLAEFTSLDKAYNVRTPNWANTAEFFADTLNAAAQWTWATMVADIWTNISTLAGALTTALVDWPTSNPYNFNFYGTSALRTLEHICDSTDHHLLVKRNGSFHIVSCGNTDATNAALLTSQATRSLIPGDPQQHAGVTVPAQVRVFFPKFNVAFQDNTDPLVVTGTEQFHVDPVFAETVTVIGTVAGITNVIANTIAPLHDSLEALYDEEGTLQNAAALTAQAEKRATEYIQGLLNSNTPREDLFHGAIGFEVGPLFAMVHWYDFGDGVRTQVFGTSSQRDEGTGDNAITEFPGLPDLSRHHLPFERFVIGKVYGTDGIPANESGTVRVHYGTQTSGTVTTWADTGLPHEITAYEIYGTAYAENDRVVCGFHRQTSRWVVINPKGNEQVFLAYFVPHETPDPTYDYPAEDSLCRKFPAYIYREVTWEEDPDAVGWTCNEGLSGTDASPEAVVVYNTRNWWVPEGYFGLIYKVSDRYYVDYVKPAGPNTVIGSMSSIPTSATTITYSSGVSGFDGHTVSVDLGTGTFTVNRQCTVHIILCFTVENDANPHDPYYIEVKGAGTAGVTGANGYVYFDQDSTSTLRQSASFTVTFDASPGATFSFTAQLHRIGSTNAPTAILFETTVAVDTQNSF